MPHTGDPLLDALLHEGPGAIGPVTQAPVTQAPVQSNIDPEFLAQPIRGPDGQTIGYDVGGQFVTPEQFQSLLASGAFPREPDRGFAPPAPPAFSGTREGVQLRGDIEGDIQAQRDVGSLQRQQSADAAALQRTQLDNATRREISRLQESEAFRRLEAEIGSDQAIARFEQSEAFRRQVLSEVGAGARAEIEQAGAFRRSLLGELGAGARADISAFTTQRGQSIGAVQDTFSRLGDLATRPSDFRRLAFNVGGIETPGATPTDTLRDRMAEFFQQQVDFTGREPVTFGETFGGLQEQFPIPEAEGFGDVFNRTREQVGVPGPSQLQFGGRPKSNAAITGERGKQELVVGSDFQVIPHLSKGEMQMLKRGGVGGAQFGSDPERRFRNIMTSNIPNRPTFDIPGPGRRVTSQFADSLAPRPITFDQGARPSTSPVSQPVRPTPSSGFPVEEPFLSAIRSGQRPTFSPAAFNAPGFTTSGFRAPRLPSLQSFNDLLPFQREMLLGAFGESVFSPEQMGMQGFDPLTARPGVRAGFDPASVLAAIRRFSPTGITSPLTRFG